MDNWNTNQTVAARSQAVGMDAGLRSYMLGVYNYMASGLALTGIVALLASQSEALIGLLYHIENGVIVGMAPLGWIVALAPIGAALFLGARLQQMSVKSAQIAFWAFAGLMGLSLTHIFLVYTGVSIAKVFFITAGAFGALSLFGYSTKKDISGWGSFLIMGVFGIIIASLVNIWLASPALHFTVSIIGVLLFAGLTAYDTQRIKSTYYQLGGNSEMAAKAGIMGALSLYLDFINLFVMLMQFFGDRR